MIAIRLLVLGALSCMFAAIAFSQIVSPDAARQSPSTAAPLLTPQIFAPGVISGPVNDGSPTFSPDGNTLFFTRSAARWSIILEAHRANRSWSEPKIAPFSGKWNDSSPAMSPDGAFLIYVSLRRVQASTTGDAQTGPGARQAVSHIWKVSRTAFGWSEPVELPAAVNFCQYIFRPSVASDGSIYFTALGQGKQLRLFRSVYRDGAYQKAEALRFSDGNTKDVDPEIAPDQSFMIFASQGRDPGFGTHEKLFLAYNHAGAWDKVVPLHYAGENDNGSSDDNDARLGSDHQTLYFSSDRTPEVHFPRTPQQASADLNRMLAWDDGNTNIWFFPLDPSLMAGKD